MTICRGMMMMTSMDPPKRPAHLVGYKEKRRTPIRVCSVCVCRQSCHLKASLSRLSGVSMPAHARARVRSCTHAWTSHARTNPAHPHEGTHTHTTTPHPHTGARTLAPTHAHTRTQRPARTHTHFRNAHTYRHTRTRARTHTHTGCDPSAV